MYAFKKKIRYVCSSLEICYSLASSFLVEICSAWMVVNMWDDDLIWMSKSFLTRLHSGRLLIFNQVFAVIPRLIWQSTNYHSALVIAAVCLQTLAELEHAIIYQYIITTDSWSELNLVRVSVSFIDNWWLKMMLLFSVVWLNLTLISLARTICSWKFHCYTYHNFADVP